MSGAYSVTIGPEDFGGREGEKRRKKNRVKKMEEEKKGEKIERGGRGLKVKMEK